MEEIWKTIEGFEDYQVSNHGRVKSLKYCKERMLNLEINNNGYCRVTLSMNNKVKRFYVHRLVALSFLKHEKSRLIINHKDSVKTNNNINNLEFVNYLENRCHSNINGKSKYTGVTLDKKTFLWRSRCVHKNVRHHLGLYKTEEQAYNARVNFEKNNNILNKYL